MRLSTLCNILIEKMLQHFLPKRKFSGKMASSTNLSFIRTSFSLKTLLFIYFPQFRFCRSRSIYTSLRENPIEKNPFFLLLACKYIKKCKLLQGRLLLLKKIWRPGISKSRGLCFKSQFMLAEFTSCCCMHSGFLVLLTYPNSLRAFLCQG